MIGDLPVPLIGRRVTDVVRRAYCRVNGVCEPDWTYAIMCGLEHPPCITCRRPTIARTETHVRNAD